MEEKVKSTEDESLEEVLRTMKNLIAQAEDKIRHVTGGAMARM